MGLVAGKGFDAETPVTSVIPAARRLTSVALLNALNARGENSQSWTEVVLRPPPVTCNLRRSVSLNSFVPLVHDRHFPDTVQ